MTELAGEIADGAVLNVQHTMRFLEEVSLPALERGFARGGRRRADFDLGVLVTIVIADRDDEAYALARNGISFYLALPYAAEVFRREGFAEDVDGGRAALERHDYAGAAAAVSDRMVDAIAVAGTAESVRQKLQRYEGVVDFVQPIVARHNTAAAATEQVERILETLAPSVNQS
jgi:alkanesulfonate monooxygenase SsuD/methylene tetrahydromethanopterin reductase-like flavin-dependent oxidoreductase (luciferase family)